jgi:PAS domain S-box-containing protein
MRPEKEGRLGSPEELLASSDALYRALVEQVPCVVYIDSNEVEPRSLFVNPQVETILGHLPSEYLTDPRLWQKTIHPDDAGRVAAEWAAAIIREKPFALEYRMVKPDGSHIWVADDAVPVAGPDGRPEFWQGVMLDVSASKRAELQLLESETRYRALVENIPAVVYVVAPDDDRRTLYLSPQVERALGYSREDWLEQPDIWMELLHPDDREEALAAHDVHNETGAPWDREYRLIASDGREVWFRDVATLVRDEEGSPRYWQGIQLDITKLKNIEARLREARDELELRVIERTFELEEANEMLSLEIGERKRAEANLRAAEARYRMLVEQMPAVTYLWDVGSRIEGDPAVYVSPQIEEMLGYTPEEWTADADFWIQRLHPDDRDEVLAEARRSEVTGETFSMEYRNLAKDGRVVWVRDEASLISRDEEGRPKLFQGMLLDITQRREAEAHAAANEARYRTLTEQLPAIVYIWSLRGRPTSPGVTYVSPQIERILGYTPEEWTSSPGFWATVVHPDDREWVLAETSKSEGTGEPWSMEYRFVARDGRVVWVHDEGRLLTRGAQARPETFQGLAVDITERVKAREETRSAEERYRELVERIPAIVYVGEVDRLEPGGMRITYISPQCEAILGYTPEEMMADHDRLAEMIHPDDRDRAMAGWNRSAKTGRPWNTELRAVAKGGRVVWVHLEAVLVLDSAGGPWHWQGVALDITARKTAETVIDLREDLGPAVRGVGAPPARPG